MLNRQEIKIMAYIFKRARGKKSELFSPEDILQAIAPKFEITIKQLEKNMKNLELDGYIEFFHSNDKGQKKYVISLKLKGEAFEREMREIRNKRIRSFGWKMALTLIAFAVTYTLGAIFG